MPTNPTATTTPRQDSGREDSAFTAPQITLPKGGGAIRGIGEKFSANAATGTGSLTVPIAISPGRSGFGPQPALSYGSGIGNGAFGIGWNLSLPVITRKTDKGLPRYRDHGSEESDLDVFVLSGQEDLMPVLKPDAQNGWILDEFERDGHRVKRYRPRIEDLFARIERWTRLEDGDIHWRSLSKDNILTFYGKDPDSRIFDPANPGHVFSWLISQSHDDRGNAILYEYAGENDLGVDLNHRNERNRVRTANRYLKSIKYGNRRPLMRESVEQSCHPGSSAKTDFAEAEWLFELVFDYREEGHYRQDPPDGEGGVFAHSSHLPQPEAAWPARRDPFSSYRSGFEIRTYRLCRRALMFHHFPGELGAGPCLVRSTGFEYDEKPVGSFIKAVVQSSYKRQPDGRYLKRSMPPLELTYTVSPLEDSNHLEFPVEQVSAPSLANLPGGIDGANYRWIDLKGEGISGVLAEQGNAWFYKPNLGHGRFGATEVVAERPSLAALNRGRQQLLDLAGAGNLNLVELDRSVGGFYERTIAGGWGGFRAFESLPVRDWKDPNLKFVDVTGDGIADILVTEDLAFTWHPSLLEEGFGPGVRIPAPHNEEEGPRVVFADGTQSIYLADMSGDGLSDIVRIRNGEICYWPNIGYGRFGAKVTMDNAPWFDDPDLFDEQRIRLADTDGSGTTDIIYLGREAVRVFLNETGNGWSDARVLKCFPPADNLTAISVVDFLGRGTACLLWSSSLPDDATRSLRYIDLMAGQKPHLLIKAINNLGSETAIEYASSTEFYLADKAAGKPWATRLPFPVHVVRRVETYDYVSRNRFVTRYTYHHGYFDGLEREFRGFGRVEQLDTEEFGAFKTGGSLPGGANESATSNVPPVLTKTWFHTGMFPGGRQVSRHLEAEYYHEPGSHESGRRREEFLCDTILPDDLTAGEAREACRSLKGSTLRQEIYAMDGTQESSRPYTVAESNFTIRTLQPRGVNKYAVFFTHAREKLSLNYERRLCKTPHGLRADPRIAHSATLEVDAFGNVLKAMAVAYARRHPFAVEPEQQRALLTLTEGRYLNKPEEANWYRIGVPVEMRTSELTRPPRADDSVIYSFEELGVLSATNDHIPYEARPEFNRVQKRLVEHVRTVYRRDDLAGPLPFGEVDSRALPFQSYKLAFTAGLSGELYSRNGKLSPAEFEHLARHDARYVHFEGDDQWWIPSGKIFYSAGPEAPELEIARQHFFLPRRFEDPFGNHTTIRYDEFDLLLVETEDALKNVVRAEQDYRVLSPRQITDPNGNRTRAAFDILGLVAGTAVMGKLEEPDGNPKGDTLEGFEPDLTPAQIHAFMADPHGHALRLLAGATSRIIYDLDRFLHTRAAHPEDPARWQPVCAATIARETHVSDLRKGQATKVQISFSYSDGFEREIQKKLQAEPGPVFEGGPVVAPRWIASGWTVFNNKGKPVEQYEPFFDDHPRFKFGNKVGVSPTLFYDPVGRVIATIHPNHTFEKVVFDPWRQVTWDVNDTVLLDPRTDPDVRGYVAAWFREQPAHWQTWFQQRIDPQNPLKDSPGLDPEQKAALRTLPAAATPGVAHFDSLGRPFLTVADNGTDAHGHRQLYRTRVVLDIEGNQREVHDALDRIVMRYDYNLLGTRVQQKSMEAGERLTLNDVAGKPVRAWDSAGRVFRTEYDELRRPLRQYVTGARPEEPAREVLVDRIAYGDGPDTGLSAYQLETANLRGKLFRHYDGAGLATNESYDFKGNLLRSRRRLARDYRTVPDWSQNPATALERESFEAATTYDALNRAIEVIAPHSHKAGAKINRIRHFFNEAGLLNHVEASLDSTSFATHFVKNIDYDAKGQRVKIDYGNGATTTYAYDPLTFRLVHLRTSRQDRKLQDLRYAFDPVGNIICIRDDAQDTLFFRNRRVEPGNDYHYDPLYRLVEAAGREHLGQSGGQANAPRPPDPWDTFNTNLDQPGDGQAMGRYVERYLYNAVGNILALQHRGSDPANPGWTREYAYCEPSQLEPERHNNRLSSTAVGKQRELYRYEGAAGLQGDITAMPHLPLMRWDYRDQLQATAQQVVNHGGTPEMTWYVYDAAGQRVRKVTAHLAAPGCEARRKSERLYLGGFEVYREYDHDGDSLTLERETLHLMDDQQRIALVETRTEGADHSPQQLVRFQFGNHLGSASLELDEIAHIISYEEYFPYGNTSYQAVRSRTEAPKRYRYTGKERDEENGFYYHGARYYAPWLGRWNSVDPEFKPEFSNSYEYVRSNPIIFHDPTGKAWTRFFGGLRAAGGLLQAAGGTVFAAVSAETVVGAVAGIAVAAHGLSDYEAGMRQLRSGQDEKSIVQIGVAAGLEKVKVEPQTAEKIATVVDIAAGFANPSGPVSGGISGARALATGGHMVPVAAAAISTVKELAPASAAIHAAAGGYTMVSTGGSGGGESSKAEAPSEKPTEEPPANPPEAPKATELAAPSAEIAQIVAKEGGLTELANNIKKMGQGKGATVEIALAKTKEGKQILVAGINSGSKGLNEAQIGLLKKWGVNVAPEALKGMEGAPHAEENIAIYLKEIGARGVRWSRGVVGALKPSGSSYVCQTCQSLIKLVGGRIE